MTDSIRTNFDLTKMTAHARMEVDATIGRDVSPQGEFKRMYDKGASQPSPMADTKTFWTVRTERTNGEFLPKSIEAKLNVPNAVTGQNVLHGTSVFAAAVSAFHLQRIWMATSGVPRAELEKLSLRDLTILDVTLSFPQICHSEIGARDLVHTSGKLGTALYGKQCTIFSSSNDTVYIRRSDYELAIYNKTDLTHCTFKSSAPVSSVLDASPTIVRIEVKLRSAYLKKHGLTSVESWRNAYSIGLYEKLFNELVRGTFRLDVENLRQKSPRPEVFAKLTGTEAHILRGYLRGLDPRMAHAISSSARPSQRFYELRKVLLRKALIDIDIPWAVLSTLKLSDLGSRLIYRGDFDPAPEGADWAFSRSSWDTLRITMADLYEKALAANAPNSAASA
jgi:hypothetical protein